jgi:hypothetical protein
MAANEANSANADSGCVPNEIPGLYNEIGAYERHFNAIQSDYRRIASQWLLAAFGAIGLAISQKTDGNLPVGILIDAIAIFASSGLLLLWNLDINVYHRLLLACFDAGCIYEDRYQELPQIRKAMRGSRNAVRHGVDAFYLISITVLLIAGVILTFALNPTSQPYGVAYCLLVISFLLIIAASAIMLNRSARTHGASGNE